MIRPLFRFGFGLENLGLLAARRKSISALVILLATIASVAMLPSLQFNGDVATLLKSERKAYADYQRLVDGFPEVASSVTLHLSTGGQSLVSKSGLQRLTDFQLDLNLLDPVERVVSPLSLRRFDRDRKRLVPAIPTDPADDDAVVAAVEAALSDQIGLGSFLSDDGDSAMVLIVLARVDDPSISRLIKLFEDIDRAAGTAGFTVLKSGSAVIQAELVGHLVRDQIVVTLLGIAAGIVIAFLVFRDWRAVLLCSSTASLALLWTLAAMAALGRPLDAMTTILPILGSILAFADGLHLLSHWRRRLYDGEAAQEALIRTIREIGPATGLTSVTTALAFAAMAVAAPALANLALFGMLTVAIAFLASIVALPVGCAWMASYFVMPGASGVVSARWLAALTDRSALKYPRAVAVGALVLITAFFAIHLAYEPSFSAVENLPAASQTRQAEAALTADFGGSDRIFAIVPFDHHQTGGNGPALEPLLAAHDALAAELGAGQVASVAGLLRQAGADRVAETEAAELIAASASRDGRSQLVIGTIPAATPAAELQGLYERLSADPALAGVTITGFPIMAAFEATHIIDRLKSGLLLAVALAAGIVGLVCRSPRVFFAVAAANLLVVLLIEAGAWAIGQPGEFALYIALTIALGIGIDDSVHILNLMRQPAGTALPETRIRHAIARAAPALAGSTIVLCANILVTAVSVLPVVTFIGLTISLTLALALIANVIILPAMLAVGRKREA